MAADRPEPRLAPGRLRPRVALVGRQNVGKSTLLNRLLGAREAIAHERPGVTRDRIEIPVRWRGREFVAVDTGGYVQRARGIDALVARQAERAAEEADVVLLVVDATTGVQEEDADLARRLRRVTVPVLVVANKVDSEAREPDVGEFYKLGLGEPLPVSALHGRGSGDLLDRVVALLPEPQGDTQGEVEVHPPEVDGFTVEDGGRPDQEVSGVGRLPRPQVEHEVGVASREIQAPGEGEAEAPKRAVPGAEEEAIPEVEVEPVFAIVGRPNVGKSSLFNRLVGEERAVVHPESGTTRDAVDSVVTWQGRPLRFVDTAGFRRPSRAEGLEYYGYVRAVRAIDRAHVVALVVDAAEGVTQEDRRIAARVAEAGRGLVVVANKWDLVPSEGRSTRFQEVRERLAIFPGAPVIRTSALTGLGVHRVLPALFEVHRAWSRRVPTAEVNEVLQRAQSETPPPRTAGRLLYATQVAARPPRFVVFAGGYVPPAYARFLEHRIRERFGFDGVPVRLVFRRRRKR